MVQVPVLDHAVVHAITLQSGPAFGRLTRSRTSRYTFMVTDSGRAAYGNPVVPDDEYYDRSSVTDELAGLFGRASRGQIGSALIEGARAVGKTDQVRRAIQAHLKAEPSAVLIYFSVQPYMLDLFDFARHYFNAFVRQYRYSRHHDEAEFRKCDDCWREQSPRCAQCGEPVLREICEALGRAWSQMDATNTLSLLVNMPHYLAELQGQRVVVAFDQARFLWQLHHKDADVPFARHLTANLESPAAPILLIDSAVALRTLLGEHKAIDNLTVFEIERLNSFDSMAMLQTLCERMGVAFNLRLADSMPAQLGGIPFYLHSLVRRAQIANLALDSSDRFSQVYAKEIRDGTIHWYWRAQFSTQFPHALDRHRAIELAAYLAGLHPQRSNLARLSQRLNLPPAPLQKLITKLQLLGVFDRSFGTVALTDDPVLRDLVTVLSWGESSAISDSELLRRLVARRIRGASSPPVEEAIAEFVVRLEKLLISFRGQYLPPEWFNYHDDYGAGWAGPEGIRKWLGSSDTLLRLPCVMNVVRPVIPAAEPAPPGPPPTILAGSGFRDKQLMPGNESAWLTVIWPAADPVTADMVQETARLRELAAQRLAMPVAHVWLIGKATFTREARRLCAQLRFFTGNMDMADYIYDQMFAQGSPWRDQPERPPSAPEMIQTEATLSAEPDTVELCLPAANYPERIATETLEQVAQGAGFSLARIGQMKMAVLEAVVHAAETSSDPADKILVRYVVMADRLEVYVRSHIANPLRQAERLRQGEGAQPLKGWGLRMIYTLADEVTIRPLEDGTEIQMTCRREAAG
jgi:anti-sigma regulatory factor (Ser/Thr protein kinase)